MVFSFKDGCFKLAQDDGAATMLLDASPWSLTGSE
jgi:hypothetical protein